MRSEARGFIVKKALGDAGAGGLGVKHGKRSVCAKTNLKKRAASWESRENHVGKASKDPNVALDWLHQ